MSRLRARCPSCRTLTAVALGDEYECHACGRSYRAGLVRVPRAWGSGGDAMARAASLPLPYPEAAAVEEDTLEEQSAALAAALPARPLVLGGCCCAHVGAIRGLAARHGRIGVVWLDAHGDLNTADSSPSGNPWGMPLRMLIDDGAVDSANVALAGARNLDPPEEAFIASVGLPQGVDGIERALAGIEKVYVALDCDVLDPDEGVGVFMPEPDGLALEDVERMLARALEGRHLVGAGLTGLVADAHGLPQLERLCSALGL